jgi:hypothetical protein
MSVITNPKDELKRPNAAKAFRSEINSRDEKEEI